MLPVWLEAKQWKSGKEIASRVGGSVVLVGGWQGRCGVVVGSWRTLETDAEGEDEEFELGEARGTDVFAKMVPCS